MFMTQAIDHAVQNPASAVIALRADLRMTPRDIAGRACYVIEDPLRGKFYRVGHDEFTFIALLDGRTSVAQAVGLAAESLRDRALTEIEALAICRWLVESQLAACNGAIGGERLYEQSQRQTRARIKSYFNPFSVRVPLCNPANAIEWLSPKLGWLFGKTAFVVWCIVGVYALSVTLENWSRLANASQVLLNRDNWWRLVAVWLGLKLFHELGHALVCRKYGGTVTTAGMFIVLFTPVPYVDVTSSWRFSNKLERMAVAAAGMYVELFLAAVAIVIWSQTGEGETHTLALNAAVMAGVGSLLVNGNPLMRFDGYYLLSDLAEIPNLGTCGQQYLSRLVTQLLGGRPPSDVRPPRVRRIIAVYAFAALVWRLLMFTVLVLALYAMLSGIGAMLATLLVTLAAALPIYRAIKQGLAGLPQWNELRPARVIYVGAAALLIFCGSAYLLLGPSTIRAHAVVEYAPLTIVRAATGGFIRNVLVHDGETVERDQLLAVLENEDLAIALRDMDLQIELSKSRSRTLLQNNEISQEQAEAAKLYSLVEKRRELKEQTDLLAIRAPLAGRIVGRNLASLEGRYLAVGDELVVIGDERKKEIVVAVPQDDLPDFTARSQQSIRVRMRGIAGEVFQAELADLQPRATLHTPHPALSVRLGGPLASRAQAKEPSDQRQTDAELLSPCFVGSVALDAEQSRRLRAGQLATVTFVSSQQSRGERLMADFRRWIQDKIRTG